MANPIMNEVIRLNTLQRAGMVAGSAIGAWMNPWRADMVAALLEVWGVPRLRTLYRRVLAVPEGRRVLKEKPLVTPEVVDLEKLRKLPPNTFGHHFLSYIEREKIDPFKRTPVRFVEDPELAYLVLRIRQAHDYFHALLNMPTDGPGELAVKIFEAAQLHLPGPFIAGLFGPLALANRPKSRKEFLDKYLPVALTNANPNHRAKLVLTAYFEKRFEQDVDEFRAEFNIIPYRSTTETSKHIVSDK